MFLHQTSVGTQIQWFLRQTDNTLNGKIHFCHSSYEEDSFFDLREIRKDRFSVSLNLIYSHFSSTWDIAFTDQKVICYYLRPISGQLVSWCSVTFSRFWWWMGANSRNGQNASCCSLFLVKVLRACPLPHWCYVKWLNTQKTAISHVTPMDGGGLASEAWQVDTYAKMGKIERFILSRSSFMSVLGNTISSKKRKTNKVSHIGFFLCWQMNIWGKN